MPRPQSTSPAPGSSFVERLAPSSSTEVTVTEWYQQDRWKPRLVAEQAVMRDRFPQFVLRRDQSTLYWEGFVDPVPGHRFLVRVSYPERYPYQEPVLRVQEPPIRPGAPHLYASGAPCIHRQPWNSQTGTAASMVPLLCAWLVAYLQWERTGETF